MKSIAELVRTALTATVRVAPVATERLPSPSGYIWEACVIQRLPTGCHVRVGAEHDVFVPAGYVPEDAEEFRVRIQPEGLAFLPAV